MVWEETLLTLQRGPQMLGFSLAHGAGGVLFLAPPLLLLWLIAAFLTMVVSLWRRRHLSRGFWSSLGVGVVTLGVLALPPVFWQWLFIGSFAKSAYADELMTHAGAEGDVRTVRGYLEHGVPLEATNYEGSTTAFTAAAGGSLEVIELLASKRANLNATNSYGDSPLEAAIERHNDHVVAFLRARGAIQVRGTPEQREAASRSIVNREMERQYSK
jgi:hypothetical protein